VRVALSAASLLVSSQRLCMGSKAADIVEVLCGDSSTPATSFRSVKHFMASLMDLPAVEAARQVREAPAASHYAKPSALQAFEEVEELLAESCYHFVAVPRAEKTYTHNFFQHQLSWISDLRCESCATAVLITCPTQAESFADFLATTACCWKLTSCALLPGSS
jgi:hypothetical protein